MPDFPQPYHIRDWQQVTRDYLDLLFDFNRKGQHLPLIRWENESQTMVWIPAFIGSPRGPESINYLAAVVSGSLVGLNMRNFRGHDWVSVGTNYFSPEDGVFLNWPRGRTQSGGSFWYDVFPNVLFCQLAHLYPNDAVASDYMKKVAVRWYEASEALGGSTNPRSLPRFDHTGFNLRTMQPFDNGHRIEPEGAAGIAWIQYMAWRHFKEDRFRIAADWCLRALEQKPVQANPLYEVLLPYAALTAARMNAELDSSYDVSRLLNWCFDPLPKPQARPNWGVITGSWNGLDVGGLVGSATDGGGYAFAMNTFQYVGTLAPLLRYDDRYARDLGKWILNAANASRLFYANAHDATHQSSYNWASQYDPKATIAYEGLRKWKRSSTSTARADYRTAAGKIIEGDFHSTHFYQEVPVQMEILQEDEPVAGVRLEHVWELELPKAAERFLVVAVGPVTNARPGNTFEFSYSTSAEGPYSKAFTTRQPHHNLFAELPPSLTGKLYVRVQSTDSSAGEAGSIAIDALAISHQTDVGPFAQGDLVVSFVALVKNSTVPIVLYRPNDVATDLGLYGSSQVGNLGGLIKPTDVDGILQVNLLKTDYFRGPAYPTYLYYNPHPEPKSIRLDEHPGTDLYDSVADAFLVRGSRADSRLTIPPGSARVVVFCPANGRLTREKSRTLVNGVVIDYRN